MPWQSGDNIKLPEINGKTFNNETIEIDGSAYVNCKFNQCKLLYRGGPTRLATCYFSPNCGFEFHDHAAFLLQTLSELGWQLVPPTWMGTAQIRRPK